MVPEDDGPVLRGVGGPFLDELPPALIDRLSEGARRFYAEPGNEIFPDDRVRTAIVVAGIVRTYLRSSDARQLTVRYARHGSMVGTISGLARNIARVRVQAVTAAEVVEIDRDVLFKLMESEPAVGQAVVNEIGRRLSDMYGAIAIDTFGSLRERIIRDLLEVATQDVEGGPLVVHMTQQALANSVGSSREVIGRTLAVLRDEGLIETYKGQIVLRDARRLAVSVAGWTDV